MRSRIPYKPILRTCLWYYDRACYGCISDQGYGSEGYPYPYLINCRI